MAVVGERLQQPEAGWIRFDDVDTKINYVGVWTIGSNSSDVYYNSTISDSKRINDYYEFYFIGTKLRIVDALANNRSSNVEVEIDGVVESYSNISSTTIRAVLVYEKLDLPYGLHKVKVTNKASGSIALDAIDIDDDGYLLAINTNKTLIEDSGNYQYYDKTSGQWVVIGQTYPTISQFMDVGMDSLTPLLDRTNGISPIDQLSDKFKILPWSTNNAVNLLLQSPSPQQIIYLTEDISLFGVDAIDKITLTANENAKVAISFDSRATWKAYKNDVWVTVANAHDGMTASEINALTKEQIAEAKGDSQFIHFSYSLTDDAEADKTEMLIALQGSEEVLSSDAYELNYDFPNKTIIYTFKRDMTVSVNYVDA